MATLAFTLDGQSFVSDVFEGGKVVQLAFEKEGTQVLYVETRLGATLPWKVIGSRIIERDLVVNIPAAGEGQEFRLNCIADPTAAEIIPMTESGGGGSQPGPNTVGTEQIIDGAVEEEDLSDDVQKKMTNTYNANDRRLTLGNVVHTDTNTADAGHQEDELNDD